MYERGFVAGEMDGRGGVGAPARLADLIDNLGAALPAAAAHDDMCASAANAVPMA